MITFHEARSIILSGVNPLGTENCPLADLLGRVLAQDIVSSFDIPPKDNSAMDGFAVRAEDIVGATQGKPIVLQVIEDVPAGKVATKSLGKGRAIRIMTGAQIPAGADAVVPVELTTQMGNGKSGIGIAHTVTKGEHVRKQGEDVKAGTVLISKGARLRPQEVGLVASLGMAVALVAKRPVVGIISSGNEIVAPGKPLAAGQIYDANRYGVAAQAAQVNAVIRDYGIVEDKLDTIITALNTAAQECDLVLTSGGVSVGDYDLMKQALSKLGLMNFWQVAQKPGKPLAFGHIKGTPVVGLPGNPVSSMVIFDQYVRPMLLAMQGAKEIFRKPITAFCDQAITKPAGRREFQRAKVEWREGAYHAVLTGAQGSGILTSMAQADGLMILEEDRTEVKPGDRVSVEFFDNWCCHSVICHSRPASACGVNSRGNPGIDARRNLSRVY
ncbi:MAG: molybdopterin molybdotransferase MoeA [Candidatus Edwardsbacteria bacterium]|nr:molybdopterin molybdotransferase MoeA [Candidatus Edwardsbacteria bacterium]